MREAFHVIDRVIERLPTHLTKDEVESYRQLARKGIFQCPFCHAEVVIKYGEVKEIHFSHKHSEACAESIAADKAEKKYKKQIERETSQHKTLIDIFMDELKMTSKMNSSMSVDYGYKAKTDLKYYPDIWLKLDKNEVALSIVTNVNPASDQTLAKEMKKRHIYFLEQGMHPVWFIENKEIAIEKEKHAIVLWEAEDSIALYTTEDRKWENMLNLTAKDLSFFHLYDYLPSMTELNIEVRSLYYIRSNDNGISVLIHRFVKDRDTKPCRAFILGEGYDIPFSKALALNNGRLNLSDSYIEAHNREQFIEKHQNLISQKAEEEKVRQEYEEQLRKEREKQKDLLREQMVEERKKQHEANNRKKEMNYNDLKILLKQRIHLTQQEQIELWSTYMLPKIGAKNAQKVWDIVEKNNIHSFAELRKFL
ncbi:competence protein CoiA family protein [Niallia endozanthoxylica]|uniref:Competence protein CoiA-like family n=1 Tax=Niallia endozanthoxylica TaxID=2036016 RepID=A0A5J5HQ94_9BACI|nr:competence protein CoiA family protein [Niallia endozanthoxylica]KAA9023933.1 competence protein CoiA-like family [Niallia endozanthoxylica]